MTPPPTRAPASTRPASAHPASSVRHHDHPAGWDVDRSDRAVAVSHAIEAVIATTGTPRGAARRPLEPGRPAGRTAASIQSHRDLLDDLRRVVPHQRARHPYAPANWYLGRRCPAHALAGAPVGRITITVTRGEHDPAQSPTVRLWIPPLSFDLVAAHVWQHLSAHALDADTAAVLARRFARRNARWVDETAWWPAAWIDTRRDIGPIPVITTRTP